MQRAPRSAHESVLGEVTATAPIRVCDVGGWTDTWFSGRGKVFNIAVTPCVEVRVRTRATGAVSDRISLEVANFGDRYGYEPGEPPGRHPLLEAIVEDVGVPDGLAIEVHVASDVPAGSSTGTSAAVAVSLIGALDSMTPRSRSPLEVARAAHRIEVERLGLQSGVQDQLCAACGGVNFIEIEPYPEATRTGLSVPGPALAELEERLLLLYLGRAHRSSEVHERVIARLAGEGQDSQELEELRACAEAARGAVLSGALEELGRAMIRNTDAQGRLHRELVNPQAQQVIDIAASHGASGWKLNGAGGEGGSLSILCGPDRVRRRSMERDLLAADPAFQVIRPGSVRTGCGCGGLDLGSLLGHRGLEIDADAARLVRVLLQPATGEGAPRDDGEVVGLRPMDGRAHEPTADAAATQRLRHLGVNQEEAVAADPVQKLGLAPVRAHHQAVLVRNIDDLHGVALVAHGCSLRVLAVGATLWV